MGIPQRLWTAIALYLLFLSGSQLTSTKAIVLASADSATNKSGSRSGLPLDHVDIVNHGDPGLPPLNLAPSSPTNRAQVYLIGFGQSGQPNRSINVIADLSQYRTEIDAILLSDRARHP
jgi:hypothetical protein